VPKTPLPLAVDTQFLYGAPGAGLGGTAELTLEADPNPYPELKGYHFGLVQEKLTPRLVPLTLPEANAAGHAEVAVALNEAPDTSLDLHAVIRVAVSEPGGRPTRKSVTLPVETRPLSIGIKGLFDGNRLAQASDGGFSIIAVDRGGHPVAAPSLHYRLVRERSSYRWYIQNGRANFKVTMRDEQLK